MRRIIGAKHVGKTLQMVKSAIQSDRNGKIIFATAYPDYIQGIIDGISSNKLITIISYDQFIEMIRNRNSDLEGSYVGIYIDDIDKFLQTLGNGIRGYALTLDTNHFMMEDVT